jgi:hypothetical protein
MRGVTRCQESTGRRKTPRDSHKFKVRAVKRANILDAERTRGA